LQGFVRFKTAGLLSAWVIKDKYLVLKKNKLFVYDKEVSKQQRFHSVMISGYPSMESPLANVWLVWVSA
jgi:hypothetical protein